MNANEKKQEKREDAVRVHLRALREAAGLTQVDLSVALGLNQSTVSKFEKGLRSCDLLLYLDWCRACGADPAKALSRLVKTGA